MTNIFRTMKELDPLIDFVRSQFHEPEAFIPLHDPRFIGNEKNTLKSALIQISSPALASSWENLKGRAPNMPAPVTLWLP